jgi:catechol 2,3-dioxygenase-like lactoylglutathione lyase family enzyme
MTTDKNDQLMTDAQMNELVAADVHDPSAWGDPIVVGASKGPRSNKQAKLLGLASNAAHALCNTRDMTIKRLDHVSVVVDDLAGAIAFFTALGMTPEGEAAIEGPWVDRINGIEGIQVDIVMMRTPDGHGRLELTKFRRPELVAIEPAIAPPNAPGLRSVMFTVESVDDTVSRLRPHGAELLGEVVQYEDKYRLCYLRGPAGIIVALAEELF